MTVLEYVLLAVIVLLVIVDVALVLWINRIAAVTMALVHRVDIAEQRLAAKKSNPIENFHTL